MWFDAYKVLPYPTRTVINRYMPDQAEPQEVDKYMETLCYTAVLM